MTTEAQKKNCATERLSTATEQQVPETVLRPGYDPVQYKSGIVHLGIGVFHRAHQAVYTDTVLAKHGGDWRITGGALRSSTAANMLNPQSGLYTVRTVTPERADYRIIGSIERVIASHESSAALIAKMAAQETRVVSATITEKGYCRDAATGGLDANNPAIIADLESPRQPKTAVACIVEAIRQRKDVGLGGFTVLSCDNLQGNGHVARRVVTEYAAHCDDALSAWIERNVTFPATMVDRICPATTDADIQATTNVLGVEDKAMVSAEPYSQWVIVDEFCNGRPRWEDAGAEFVTDVEPYEKAKLRILNGSHSALAYIGRLESIEFVHQVLADNVFEAFVQGLTSVEVRKTLKLPSGFDCDGYIDNVITRFKNSALPYSTAKVAMDGSQKIPERFLGTAQDLINSGKTCSFTAMAVALWLRYITLDTTDSAFEKPNDPMQKRLSELPRSSKANASKVVDAALGIREVFGSKLPHENLFRDSLIQSLTQIVSVGVPTALHRLIQGEP